MNRPTWHEYFLMLAKLVSARSTCNSRKVGAIIVRDNKILATGYNGAVHGASHCSDRGPDYCLRRDIGVREAEKFNYCLASHAEVNAINQAARFGASLGNSTLYCTLEPCNWCFKQLIQAGIKEIYFEIAYDSPNKEFDEFWRQIMETHQGLRVFEQISVSDQAKNFMLGVLAGDSTRKLAGTDTLTSSGFKKFTMTTFGKNSASIEPKPCFLNT